MKSLTFSNKHTNFEYVRCYIICQLLRLSYHRTLQKVNIRYVSTSRVQTVKQPMKMITQLAERRGAQNYNNHNPL